MVNYYPLFVVAHKMIIANLKQFQLIYYLSQFYLIPLFILFSLISFSVLYISYVPPLQQVRAQATNAIITHVQNNTNIPKTHGNVSFLEYEDNLDCSLIPYQKS
jgi:hypothetical protein